MPSTPLPSASPPAGYLSRWAAQHADNAACSQPADAWLEVRDRRSGKLLCKYNPRTAEILVVRSGRIYVADLPGSRPHFSQEAFA